MARGLPALFTTRSGRPLAREIAKELTSIMENRLQELAREPTLDKRQEAEIQRINRIRAMNVEYFGKSRGGLFPRHIYIEDFSDGEIHVVIDDYKLAEEKPEVANSVRGQDVFLVSASYEPPRDTEELIRTAAAKTGSSDMTPAFLEELVREIRKDRSVNDNVMEAMIALRTLSICDAERVTWICPSAPYARQDRSKEREASIAKLVQEFSEVCRVSHAVFEDLHADQIKSYYQDQFQTADNIQASRVLLPGIQQLIAKSDIPPDKVRQHFCVESPDAGAMKRARWYANKLGIPLAYADKMRDYSIPNSVAKVIVIGDVKDRHAIIIDDLLDTGGTLVNIANETV
ncbi:TPA: ribose-phosphate pyrophosphokinase, partial [Candidatus Woesearchaeota archaeon]|nr:ribose-phosphate pyrophosphokinase [Candidatus Woesearchaeota archaeon]